MLSTMTAAMVARRALATPASASMSLTMVTSSA
jgi:hypothetical protein